MASVYILYTVAGDKFYTGSCLDFQKRFDQHINKLITDSFTNKIEDWELFLKIDDLEYSQSRKIERHIKNMKSKKYILNLKKYPEMVLKLKQKYNG